MQKRKTDAGQVSLTLAVASLKMTKELLQRYRYRLAGGPDCLRAAHEIAETFRKSCDGGREEAFALHPKALWFLGRTLAAVYLLSGVAVVLGGYFTYAACLSCLGGLAYGLCQYVFYGKYFDRFFRSAQGLNVVGTLEPGGAVERQVVLVGHHDSPYIFSFLERFQAIAYIRFLLGMASFIWLTACSAFLSARQLLLQEASPVRGAALWITVGGLVFALQLFFMMSRHPSPGAGDNLNAASMLAAIAGHFKEERAGDSPLRRTRLILLSTDGEEIGQRGAIEYVRRHVSELKAMPTFVINVDSVYYYKDLAVLTRDRNRTCALSRTMALDVHELARESGIQVRIMAIPFGGGGTDAAAFAAAGIEAVSLIGQPTRLVSKDHLYHTSRDVAEGIEIEAVRAIIEILIGFVRKVDREK
jgi:aminopeptidase YwaD